MQYVERLKLPRNCLDTAWALPVWVTEAPSNCPKRCGSKAGMGTPGRVLCSDGKRQCSVKNKPAARQCPPGPKCGDWLRGSPTNCAKYCGGANGIDGLVTCSTKSCDSSHKPAARKCPKVPLCGQWIRGPPSRCTKRCGGGTGIDGAVTCSTSVCDPATKPEPDKCVKPPPCGVWSITKPENCPTECSANGRIYGQVTCSTPSCDEEQKPFPPACAKPLACEEKQTVPALKAHFSSDRRNRGLYFTVNVTLNVPTLGDQRYRLLLDTGSTGVVVVPHDNSVQRSIKSCSDFRPCVAGGYGFLFTKCFADGSGYRTQSAKGKWTLFGHTADVSFADAVEVFDYDGSMYDSSTDRFINTFGLGGHGKKACTDSSTDLLSDFTKSAKLARVFSLRSVSITQSARLYIGGSDPSFDALAKKERFLIDPQGHYVATLTGFETLASGSTNVLKTKLRVILDTGSSVSIFASKDAMQTLLHALKAICRDKWAHSMVAGNSNKGKHYEQYSCAAAAAWRSEQLIFAFKESKTPPLPLTNMVTFDTSKGSLTLLVLYDTVGEKSVLGMPFFTDHWVEFNLDTECVRFAQPTSAQSYWGPWSLCPCSSGDDTMQAGDAIQTRACTAGGGPWCSGPSTQHCTPEPCPKCPSTCNGHSCDFWVSKGRKTCAQLEDIGCDCRGCSACEVSVDGELAWTGWGACSVSCGDGVQGRGTRVLRKSKGKGVMLQPQGHNMRKCHQGSCLCTDPMCGASEFCLSCPGNNYQSCTSCNTGCTRRQIDHEGHYDCKGTGEWGPVPGDDAPVVVHGRRALRGT